MSGLAAPSRAHWAVALVSLALAIAWYAWQGAVAASLPQFGDETEHLVVARRLIEERNLYSEIHVQHGPFNYALGHVWGYLVGTSQVLPYRLLQAGLVAGLAVAAAFSPALLHAPARIGAAAITLGCYASIAAGTGLYLFQYQALGGLCFGLFAVFVLMPALLGEDPPPVRGAIGGAGMIFAGFNAYSFGVAMIFGALAVVLAQAARSGGRSALWRRVRAPLTGALLAGAAMLFWLLIFGDVLGFAVFHIYLNQAVYTEYISFNPFSTLTVVTRLRTDSVFGLDVLLVHLVLALTLTLIAYERFSPPRPRVSMHGILALGATAVAMLYLNPRGYTNGFHAAGLVAGVIPFGAVALMRFAQRAEPNRLRGRLGATGLIVVLFGTAFGFSNRMAVSTPHELRVAHRPMTLVEPLSVDPQLVRHVRLLVPEGQPFQALVFSPEIYAAVGRLPTSGYHFYFPWLAHYERAPVPGYSTDLCADLYRSRPRAIYYDAWKVWGQYDPARYAPCVHDFISNDYLELRIVPRLYASVAAVSSHPWLLAVAGPLPAECLGRIGRGCAARRQAERLVRPETGRLVLANGSCLTAPRSPALHTAAPLAGRCQGPDARFRALPHDTDGFILVDRTGARCLERTSTPRVSPQLAPCTGAEAQRFRRLPGPDGASRFAQNARCIGGTVPGLVPCNDGAVWRPDPKPEADPMAGWAAWVYPPLRR